MEQRSAPMPLRIPDDLKAWLRSQAESNRRSMNGEVLYRLEQSRKQQAGSTRVPA
jgi:hypothetical protein